MAGDQCEVRKAIGSELRLVPRFPNGRARVQDSEWKEWLNDIDLPNDMAEYDWLGRDGSERDLSNFVSTLQNRGAGSKRLAAALYYRLHYHDILTHAHRVDEKAFQGKWFEDLNDGIPVFESVTHPLKPSAPFIHPPYVSAEYIKQRLEADPTDGLWLNPHNHHSITFSGRQKERAHLDAFMRREETFLICPVIGPSGSGKTRLVSEWMKPYVPSVSATNWDAGFVGSREVEPWITWSINRDTLIVIDYTFAYNEVVKQIAQRARADGSGHKIRLLVIDQVFPKELFNDTFWQNLYKTRSLFEGNYGELYQALELRAEGSESELLRDIAAAVAKYGNGEFHRDHPSIRSAIETLHRMGESSAETGPLSNSGAVRHPLFAALLGHAIWQGRDFSHWHRHDLIQYYFQNGDRLPWHAWSGTCDQSPLGLAVGALISAATLCRGLPISNVKALLPGNPDALVQYANRIVSSENMETLKPFEPDILGEVFLLSYLHELGNRKADKKKQQAWGLLLQLIELAADDAEKLRKAQSLFETVQRLTANLLNDDQQSAIVNSSWSILEGFLDVDQFNSDSTIRPIILALRMATISQCRAKMQIDRARQFAKSIDSKDIQAIQYGPLWHPVALSFTHYFDWRSLDENGAGKVEIATLSHLDNIARGSGEIRTSMLLLSASEGCLETLKATIDELSYDINYSDSRGWTALILAVTYGHTDLVSWLINQGADMYASIGGSPWSALMVATAHGHIETAEFLLNSGAEIDEVVGDSGTALLVASANGQINTVNFLLERGAQGDLGVKYDEWTPLMAACRWGHTEIAKILLDHGVQIDQRTTSDGSEAMIRASETRDPSARKILERHMRITYGRLDSGWTALMEASQGGHTDTAKMLLDRGARVDQRTTYQNLTALAVACRQGHTETAALLLDRGAQLDQENAYGETPFRLACNHGHTETAALLLDRGVQVDQGIGGRTPLFVACEQGHTETAALLIDRGAQIDQEISYSGETPLIVACVRGHTKTAALLLERGAKVNKTTMVNETALIAACSAGNLEIVRLLLDRGAKVGIASTREGTTAIMTASANGYAEIVNLLLKHSARADQSASNGWTPLMMACSNRHPEVVRLLLNAGAEANSCIVDNWTPLILACRSGCAKTATILLDTFSPPERIDISEINAALAQAAKNGHKDVAVLLMRRGAKIDASIIQAFIGFSSKRLITWLKRSRPLGAALKRIV